MRGGPFSIRPKKIKVCKVIKLFDKIISWCMVVGLGVTAGEWGVGLKAVPSHEPHVAKKILVKWSWEASSTSFY